MGGAGFVPGPSFFAGAKGIALDLTDMSKLYQDRERTTLVTATGQPIGSPTDLSGNNAHPLAAANDTTRPTFDGWATFDGSNDGWQTPAIDLTGTDKLTVILGLTKSSDAAQGAVVEFSASLSSNNGTFLLYAPRATGVAGFQWYSKGTTAVAVNVDTGYAAPVTGVLSGINNISGDSAVLRFNGVQIGANGSDQGTGNFGNHVLNIGARNNASLRFNGRIYRMIVIGRLLSADELAAAEAWCGLPFS